jgi:hypothetical protein
MSKSAKENGIIREFFDALDKQERYFAGRIATDRLGLVLRIAINELDWFSYNLAREREPTFEQQEQYYLLHIGVTRLIKLALEARPSFDVPTVTVRRDLSLTGPVLEVVAGLGMIEHGRRVAQMAMTGFGHIERTGVTEFVITLPPVLPDEEYYERAVADHFEALARDDFAKFLQSEVGRELAAEVDHLLTEFVYTFMDHFIGYDAHPVLDDYFFGLAAHSISTKKGYDSFHYSVTFGGVSFQKYVLGLTFLISLAIRHERFAEALVAKDPNVRLENVLTISAEIAPFLDDLRAAINHFGSTFEDFEETTAQDAQTIFKVLSVGRDNMKILDRPGSPLPALIRTSESDCIRCQSAILANPVQFLLDSLRYHFPRDYDSNQRGRERSMQLAIRRVLDGVFSDLLYRDNIEIRAGGRTLTDIDVVVLEPATGAVLLMQLKHQDIYGMDIHSRYTRGSRLKQQAESWLAAMNEWTRCSNDKSIRATLRLPPDFPSPLLHRIILTRHFSYPIANLDRSEDVAFANWNQFYNATLVMRQKFPESRLIDFVAILRAGESPGGPQQHEPEPRSEWIINELKFTTEQQTE